MNRALRLSTLVAAVLLVSLSVRADGERQGGAPLFDGGNSAFLTGDNARATASWQALIDEGVASAELETNLGVALSRQGKRGLSVLHFERALHLDSGDDDTRADLVEVRRSNVDRLEGEEDSGGEALFRLLAPLPGRALALLLLGAWTLAWLLVGARALFPTLAARPPLATATLVCFTLAAVAGLGAAGAAMHHKLALRRAVVVAAAVPAREGPQVKAVSHFEVHEGTLVRVEDAEGGWRRIKLQNGLIGWVPSESVELVVPPSWGGLLLR